MTADARFPPPAPTRPPRGRPSRSWVRPSTTAAPGRVPPADRRHCEARASRRSRVESCMITATSRCPICPPASASSGAPIPTPGDPSGRPCARCVATFMIGPAGSSPTVASPWSSAATTPSRPARCPARPPAGVIVTGRMASPTPPPLGLLWFDAHADLNTPDTTPSGNPHGMPAGGAAGSSRRAACRHRRPARHVRSTSRRLPRGSRPRPPGERRAGLDRSPRLGPSSADRWRCIQVRGRRLDRGSRARTDRPPDGGAFALSFDLDVIDPKEAPGVNLPVPDGLTSTSNRSCRSSSDWPHTAAASRWTSWNSIPPRMTTAGPRGSASTRRGRCSRRTENHPGFNPKPLAGLRPSGTRDPR